MTARQIWIVIAMVVLTFAGSARAATWGGGTNDWASDNWGLDAPDGYPGDTNYITEGASLTVAGQAQIKAGDWMTNNAVCYADVGTIKQTGGVLINNVRMDIRTRIDLLGGTITGNGSFRAGGADTVWNVDGGELGTRLGGPPGVPAGGGQADLNFSFRGASGTLLVTESGIVDLHTIDMGGFLPAGGTALVEAHGVVAGAFDRATLFWKLYKSSVGTSATVKFVFSAAGISPWVLISNNSLNLGTGADRGLLEVDVAAFNSDGMTAYPLFDYLGAIQGDGTFGSVSASDEVYGVFALGTQGSLQPGEYFLDYAYDSGGGDMNIAIYFNNPPLPVGTVISVK